MRQARSNWPYDGIRCLSLKFQARMNAVVTPEEAFLIFDKLRTEAVTVFCTGRLHGWNLALRGKIVSVSKEEVIIVSADRHSGSLSVRLDAEDLLIRYVEPRETPFLQGMPEHDQTLAGITLSLPLRVRPSDLKRKMFDAPPREVLFILQLPDD